jgi:hypothetical protein
MSIHSSFDGMRFESSMIDSPAKSGRAWLCSAALLATLPLAQTSAQEVIKPTGTTTVSTGRLPSPQRVTVRQNGSMITLTWGAVAGAKYYVLGRAVGTEGFRRLLDASTGPDTVYIDRRITVGVKHVYTVTPISDAEVSGIRATSDSIVPTTTTTTTTETTPTTTPTTSPTTTSPTSSARIAARLMGTADIEVQWAGTGGYLSYHLRHVLNDVPMAATLLSERYLVQKNVAPGRHRYDLMGSVFGTGTGSVIASSEVVTVAPATTGTTGTTGTPTTSPTTSTAAPAGTTVTVPAASAVALRIGATMPLGAGQWTSLTPTIASVSADGTVTGLAAGTAQISALAVQSDGSVRVTVVRVAVQP